MVSAETKKLITQVAIILGGVTVLGALAGYFLSKILVPSTVDRDEATAIHLGNALKGAMFGLAVGIIVVLYMAYKGKTTITTTAS